MTLVVSDQGNQEALKRIINFTGANTNWVLRLFTNNHTPAAADVCTNYTESVASGYSAKTLTGSSWTVSTDINHNTTATYPSQTFSFSATDTIYGYYLTDSSKSILFYSELASGGVINVGNGGSVTVNLTLQG